MPPAIKQINWLPVVGFLFTVASFTFGVVYTTGVRDAATRVEIEQLKRDVAATKTDHDLLVSLGSKMEDVGRKLERIDYSEVRTRVDELVKKIDRIEAKLDAKSEPR